MPGRTRYDGDGELAGAMPASSPRGGRFERGDPDPNGARYQAGRALTVVEDADRGD